jgi:hypothetical protein
MRLRQIEQVLAGQPVSDIVRVLRYRPEIFGRYVSDAMHELLQGPSAWNTGERELFAAFVSSRNKCVY